MRPKILVIGSREHDRAYCVDWLQPFPNIEEYDSVIINLKSLTQEIFDKIHSKISREMSKEIETLLDTDREVFCIIDRHMIPSPPTTGFKGYVALPDTNYDWLPITIKISDRKKGTSINVSDHKFDKYFHWVDKWNFEISESLRTTQEFISALRYDLVPVAENKSKKMIGGTLKHGGFSKNRIKGAIYLLPPTTKCDIHQAIEILLDLVCGEEVKIVPPWRKDIEVPKIQEFEQEIENKIKDIKGIQREISQIRSQIREWDSYRDLLTTTGDDFENIVQKALSDIGIKTKKTEKGFPADLVSDKFAIEITGIKGCVGVGSEKVIQTGRFKQNYHKGEKIVLIANTYIDLPPKKRKRKIDFSPEVEKYFKSLSVCCFSGKTLFELWKDVVTGKRDPKDVRKKILTKKGALTLDEF